MGFSGLVEILLAPLTQTDHDMEQAAAFFSQHILLISAAVGCRRRLQDALGDQPAQACRQNAFGHTKAFLVCGAMELALMKADKKAFEFDDCIVMVTVRSKKPPKADNDNLTYDFWSDELKEFLDRYDK
jgi:hypothetical protein